MTTPVTAAVLASRGGARLARALASVDWAAERIVLDPAHRVATELLPAGVARAVDLEIGSTSWLLVLEEGDAVPPTLAATIARAVATDDADAYRIPQAVTAFGVTLGLRGAPVRLARRREARVGVRAGGLDVRPVRGRIGRLAPPLETRAASTLASALEELDADAAALAAVLHARRIVPRLRHLGAVPFVQSARALAARGPVPIWPRWALAVFGGYRTVVAYAKLWELRRAWESTAG